MADPIKVLSTEIALSNSTPNTVSSASLVRMVNMDGANSANISLAYSNGTIKAVFTLGHHGTDFGKEFVVKLPSDTLTISGSYTGSGVRAVSVGYI